jgi:CRP-like cAMP-binding protein
MSVIPSQHRSERNCLLAALPDFEYERLASELEDVQLRARQLLALPDAPMSRVYFGRGAVVSMLVPMLDGSAIECATVGREGMVGLEALLSDGTAHMEVVVHVGGDAAALDAYVFRNAVSRSAELRRVIRQYTQSLLYQIERTAGCNLRHPVHDRVARVLLMVRDAVGQSTFPLTQDMLAAMLGVRRASVTQAASSLHSAGLIRYRRGLMTILDADGLRAAACIDYQLTHAIHERLRVSMWD